MSDKRSVATDALETLGTVPIPSDSGRDAIHLAVEPVIAAEVLKPGQDVGLLPDGKASHFCAHVGIVDPFLKKPVKSGQKFWLVVYPRQITSLRHVWTHPAFAEESTSFDITEADKEVADRVAKRLQGMTPSQQWMKEYSERLGVTYEQMMEHAKDHADNGNYWTEGGRFEGENIPDGFWDHYEKITNEEVDESNRGNFFRCSC